MMTIIHLFLISETPWLDLLPEVPAFLCDRVNIECDVRRSADMTVVDDIRRQRRNMLYLSRGQLKKHSNTSFNICVSVRYISQQVKSLTNCVVKHYKIEFIIATKDY
jgi:hypothetical protein